MRTATRTKTSGTPRRVPQRTCVACRRTGDQPSFVRIVRSPEGAVRADEGRRPAPGRGAYLCRERSCWERGLRGALGGALRTALTEEDREALRQAAGRLDIGDSSRGGTDGSAATDRPTNDRAPAGPQRTEREGEEA
ncbi:MAG: YlxR family protein [Dehalococcoidia bacterium]|nr:YlxR family protein [Dehalococcoidia bacterium]